MWRRRPSGIVVVLVSVLSLVESLVLGHLDIAVALSFVKKKHVLRFLGFPSARLSDAPHVWLPSARPKILIVPGESQSFAIRTLRCGERCWGEGGWGVSNEISESLGSSLYTYSRVIRI